MKINQSDFDQKTSMIGGRLKVAREALGLSQEKLGDLVGSSKRGIQDNEARDRVPGGTVVPKLIEMGISANWLLANKGPMFIAGVAGVADGVRVEFVAQLFNRYAMKRAMEWLDAVLQENPDYFEGRDWDGVPDDQRRPESLWRAYQRALEQIESYRDGWIRLVFSFDPPMPDPALQAYFPTWIEHQVQQSHGET